MLNFFSGKHTENPINRRPTQKEENLILELRKLQSADVEIGVSETEPTNLKLYNAMYLDSPDTSPLKNEEIMLLQVLRFMLFGQACITVENGIWTGSLGPQTHINIKL